MAKETPLLPEFTQVNGLPQPDWADFLERLKRAGTDEHDPDAWEVAVRAWLNALAEAMGDSYHVWVSGEFRVVAGESGEFYLAAAKRTLDRVRRLLGSVGGDVDERDFIVMIIDDHERYYDYVDHFHPDDGEYGASVGMNIRSFLSHVVIGPSAEWTRRGVLAHELTHDYLSTLTLPLWLEEGVTQAIEERELGVPVAGIDAELLQRERAYWGEHGLTDFWTGAAFAAAEEAQELAYALSVLLFRNLVTDYRRRAAAFVREASWEDAGDQAAREHLGISVGQLAGRVLGPGDWSPPPRIEGP